MADLRVLAPRPAVIREEVVDLLEEALRDARAGNIASVAVAVVLADGMTVRTAHSRSDHHPALLGSVALLQDRLLRVLDG